MQVVAHVNMVGFCIYPPQKSLEQVITLIQSIAVDTVKINALCEPGLEIILVGLSPLRQLTTTTMYFQ